MPEMQETDPRRLEIGSAVTIAGLGDSLTQGWMVKKGFFDRFCDRLSEK